MTGKVHNSRINIHLNMQKSTLIISAFTLSASRDCFKGSDSFVISIIQEGGEKSITFY